MYLTEALAKYAVDYNLSRTAPEIVDKARIFFADGAAVMIAAANEPPVRIAKEYARLYGGASEASIIVSGEKTDALTAAMVNGISAHYLDYDDVADTSNAHVSALMVPTVLAAGESVNADGKSVLEAYIVGIEVCNLLSRCMGKENFRKGWHSTASLGIFGACAAAGKLFGLNEQQMTYLMGLAASESSGIKANFGTMAKSFHVGSAASKAIRIARLAALGYDSMPSCIEAKCGFADLTIGETDFSVSLKAIEDNLSEFIEPGMIMKPYPSCKASHNGIDAAIGLAKEYDLKPEDVDYIEAEVQPYVMDLLRYPHPETKLQGKFSLNYTIAVGIINRAVQIKDFEGEYVTDPQVIDLMDRVKVIPSETMNNGETMLVRGDTIVHIFTKDGRELVKRVNYATGDPHAPMPEAQRRGKLTECLSRTLCEDAVGALIEKLEHIDELAHIADLTDAVAKAKRQ